MGDKNRTMCEYKKDEIKENLEEIKKLVVPAKFICRKCARTAVKEASLCKPEKI